MALAATLRREVSRARTDFHVINLQTQRELDVSHTIRERLLARLALFFAPIALLLAGAGLYGVLDYSVLQRRREIGIRLAVGAPAGSIGRLVTVDVLAMVTLGTLAGLLLGMASVRFVDALLYQVKPSEPMLLAFPVLSLLSIALLAGVPAVVRALGIDPVETLRSE
jgi:ABC-type antimicrobial peptide transport system permease subunit